MRQRSIRFRIDTFARVLSAAAFAAADGDLRPSINDRERK